MYRCEECSRITGPNEPQFRVVTERRPKVYYELGLRVGEGWEIVVEKRVCSSCHRNSSEQTP